MRPPVAKEESKPTPTQPMIMNEVELFKRSLVKRIEHRVTDPRSGNIILNDVLTAAEIFRFIEDPILPSVASESSPTPVEDFRKEQEDATTGYGGHTMHTPLNAPVEEKRKRTRQDILDDLAKPNFQERVKNSPVAKEESKAQGVESQHLSQNVPPTPAVEEKLTVQEFSMLPVQADLTIVTKDGPGKFEGITSSGIVTILIGGGMRQYSWSEVAPFIEARHIRIIEEALLKFKNQISPTRYNKR